MGKLSGCVLFGLIILFIHWICVHPEFFIWVWARVEGYNRIRNCSLITRYLLIFYCPMTRTFQALHITTIEGQSIEIETWHSTTWMTTWWASSTTGAAAVDERSIRRRGATTTTCPDTHPNCSTTIGSTARRANWSADRPTAVTTTIWTITGWAGVVHSTAGAVAEEEP